MSVPASSLSAQISAVERAKTDVPRRKDFSTEGQMLLEQRYLTDAVRTLEWVSTHSAELKAFLAAMKEQGQ